MDDFADAVMRLEDEVDAACNRALAVLTHDELIEELERIVQGWKDAR